MSEKPKVKIATIWLSGCSGCHMSVLDLDERLIDLTKLVEITASPITDLKEIPPVDVGIVEGCVNNDEQEQHLKDLRAQCKILVALGDCAVTGNVPALRNQFPLQDVLARGFVSTESTQIGEIPSDPIVPRLFPQARPVHEVVKVEVHIPGCPPDADTIWYALTELLAGRLPQWNEKNLRYD
ncbi:NADP oxidoreductase [bacterium]|nr:NADP oxidoreductase [bacterium]